jgi:glycosyltransferase involved in cell wall biosynthesis
MRIGMLTTSFPRWPEDIPGHFVLGFARALAARGHSLEVLAPEPRERVARPSWPGVDVHWVPYVRPRSAARTFYGAGVPDNVRGDPVALVGALPFTGALLAAAVARRSTWDAVISHWALPCGLIGGLVHETRPHLCVLHSADLHLLSRLPLRTALATRIANGATCLLFVSHAQRERFIDWIDAPQRASVRARSALQPMGIDDPPPPLSTDARAAARARLGLDRFTLLTIARLVPVKGLHEALSSLAPRDDLEWLIAGEGPERGRLQAVADRARLRVRLLGNVTGDCKRTLLQAADAFVLPSVVLPSGRSEGAPTALLEAMGHDLPVIASEAGGIRELVAPNETGLLIDPRAPGALAMAVDQLRGSPALARELARRAVRFADGQRWSAIAPRLERLLLDSNHDPSAIGYADVPSPLQKGPDLRS